MKKIKSKWWFKMNSIIINENKILKLQNVLSRSINLKQEVVNNFEIEIEKMKTYIKAHNSSQIGPLIQYSKFEIDEDEEVNASIKFLIQSNNYIQNVEPPFKMESILKVPNCLYARYVGPEEMIKYAYDKLGVYAFENEINLCGDNYTVYVDSNKSEETIIADIFMPTKQG